MRSSWRLGLKRVDTGSLSKAQPLFVIGCPRSGTTFVAKLLNAHPAILMTNETAIFIQLNHLINASRTGIRQGIMFGKEYHGLWADHLAAKATELIEGYYAKIALAQDKRRLRFWGEKHPNNVECIEWIDALYPRARYLYVIRDPRDTALSVAKMLSCGFSTALNTWQAIACGYERFVAQLPNERLQAIRYEDLVADYEGQTRALLDWLGLKFDPAVRRFLQLNHTRDVHRPEAAPQDFRSEAVGRWRRRLTPSEMLLALEVAGDYMTKYRYERYVDARDGEAA